MKKKPSGWSTHSISKRAVSELEALRQKCRGVLHAEEIVRYARARETALHLCFEWDDSAAAQAYRIDQAKRLLRVVVTVLPSGGPHQRMYVSLSSDRDGTYRHILDVLSDKESRARLLEDALMEMTWFERKYHRLKELSGVFKEVSKARLRHGTA